MHEKTEQGNKAVRDSQSREMINNLTEKQAKYALHSIRIGETLYDALRIAESWKEKV